MKYPKGLSVVPTKGLTIARLYKTNIVTIDHCNNTIQLESGNWRTPHTKKCMNLILAEFGYSVYQKKGEWYVSKQDIDGYVPYFDGMNLAS